jgi:hypothetical protein
MIYLTGVSNPGVCELARGELWGQLGILVQPETFYLRTHVEHFCRWAFDNACFGSGGDFDEHDFLIKLEWIINNVEGAHECCQFANAPDVFNPNEMKGDARATIDRSLPVLKKIRDIGAPAGLVFQDGLQEIDDSEIPWDEFDVAFMGGSDEFKLGYYTDTKQGNPLYLRHATNGTAASESTQKWAALMQKCHERGKPIHVGRVSSKVRLLWGVSILAETADGTFFSYGRKCIDQMRRWLPEVNKYEDEQWKLSTQCQCMPSVHSTENGTTISSASRCDVFSMHSSSTPSSLNSEALN